MTTYAPPRDDQVEPADGQEDPSASIDADARDRWITPALVGIVVVGVALRAWRLGFNGLSYDESFTAMAARLRLDRLFTYLRTEDSHPPLDYLVRVPFARAGVSDAVLRLPSFACSVAALTLFAWWMRTRGLAGVVAAAIFAGSSFQVYHGGEVRMYALLQLLGVASAIVAERWLHDDSRGASPWIAAGLVALALFDHVSGFLLVSGMVSVAGLRRDRAAWVWRAAIACAVAIWAACWGTAFAEQARGGWVLWIPLTSPGSFASAVSGQVTDVEPLAWLVLTAVALGGWCLWRADRRLGRIWLAVGVVPFAVAAAIGAVSPFLIDRAVTVASWAPPLALGFFGAALVSRWVLGGRAVVVALVAVVLAGTVSFLAGKRYDSDLVIAHLQQVARPGDVIATRPDRYATLPAYRIGVERWQDTRWVAVPGIDGAAGFRAGDARPTGRIWLFTPESFELAFPGYRSCPSTASGATEPWTDGVTYVVCLEAAR